MRSRILLVAWLIAAPLPAAAQGFDAWTTMLRIRTFTDLLATRDAVWCASGEGGLLRWDRDSTAFHVIRRVPGGLSSNRLTALATDRQGRLWVGTESHGISRLSSDGRRWDAVNLLDGLPPGSVQVLEAQGDSMWIGAGAGIALWNGAEISGSLPDGNTVSYDVTFGGAEITGIAVLGDEVWVSSRAGIGYAHRSTGLTDWQRAQQGIPVNDTDGLASDGVRLFAHAAGFVYRWNGAQWDRESYPIPNETFNLVDDAGIVVASTRNGVWTHDGTSFVESPGSPSATQYFQYEPTVDSSGVVFAATESGLLAQPPSGPTWSFTPSPEGPPGNDLNSVFVDGPRIYVTGFIAGVGRFDGRTWRNWPAGRCASGCDTTFLDSGFAFGTMVDRRGRKWTAHWSSAIERFDDSVSPPRFEHLFVVGNDDSAYHSFGKTFARDSTGRMWVGLDRNLFASAIAIDLYDTNGVFVRNFNPNNQVGMSGNLVHTLSVSRNGRLWIGYNGNGIDFVEIDRLPFNPNGLTFTPLLSTTGLEVRGIVAHGDSLWMLTPSELRRYSATANTSAQPIQAVSLTGAGGSSQFSAHPLEVGPDGTVWVGTIAGVFRFRRGVSTPDRFTTANSPLADNEVRSIDVDPVTGVVWIATLAGLSRFDPGYVTPPEPELPALHVRVYPNPAVLHGAGLRLRIQGEGASYRGAIFDVAGRRVREFSASNGSVFWDGRDDAGSMVEPGIYFVRAEAGGRTAVTRIALVQ